MKKIIALVLVFALVLALTACTATTAEGGVQRNPFDDRFTKYSASFSNAVFVDNVTGVCYLWRASGYSGGLTVMLDADGSPLIYKED